MSRQYLNSTPPYHLYLNFLDRSPHNLNKISNIGHTINLPLFTIDKTLNHLGYP